jgi:hypothetical protein
VRCQLQVTQLDYDRETTSLHQRPNNLAVR